MENYINKVIEGDCLEMMKRIPDKSIDLIVTDPPYGIGIAKKIHYLLREQAIKLENSQK